jgi:hypothetical protein
MIPSHSSGERNSFISRLQMPTKYSNAKHHSIFLALSVFILLSIAGGTFLTFNLTQSESAHAAAPDNTAVENYKYNNGHTGLDANETILNTSNVNEASFGKKISYPVDGQIYAQPLYVPNLTVDGATHNVVFVETENDSIYAFDADQTNSKQALWQVSFLTNGATPVSNTDVSCNDMVPSIGITGTPVIDSTTNTMYVVAYTKENGKEVYRLHALDITTGQEKTGSPTILQGSVAGTGAGEINGKIAFDPLHERQRAALLMENGNIYIAFASFCDNSPYHGWIMSYSTTTLQQTYIYNDSANGTEGGIWAAGGPLVTDSAGNIYFISGNGDFNLNVTGGVNASDSIVKISPQLKVLDYFTPFNQLCLEQTDADLGSGGILVVPDTNEFIQSGKEGRIYVLNTSSLGEYTPDPNLSCAATSTERQRTDIDKVVQELPPSTVGGIYTTPAYWNGNVYFTGANDHTKAFSFSNGKLSTAPTSQSSESSAFSGGGAIVSSDGTASGTGIVWTNNTQGLGQPGVLHAYDATDLSKELYNSNMDPGRDALDSYVKFAAPIVANGEVFVPTAESLNIYGLLNTGTTQPTPTPIATSTAPGTPTAPVTPTATPPTTASFNNVGISDDTQPGVGNLDNDHNSYSADALRTYAGINEGDNTFYNGMVFTWPDTPSGTPDNYVPAGQTIAVDPLSNANILGFLGASTGGLSYGKVTINYTDGSTQAFTLGFSDWTLGAGKVPVSFGNGKLATLLYRNTATSFQLVTNYVFYADVAMPAGKTVKSVTLPKTTTGGTMHIFAISTKQGAITTNPPTIPYNNIGTSDDTNMAAGKLDGTNSLSAQASQLAGLIPGASVTVDDATFVWPAADPGQANNYVPKGQTIPINPVNNAQTLAILGTATNGLSQGTATITYSDGTTQQFTLSLSDWTLNKAALAPANGDQIAVSMPYLNTPTGKLAWKAFVFYTEVGLQAGKTVASVTLPSSTTGGQMHVFAVATKADPADTSGFNNAGISNDTNTAGASLSGTYSYSEQALQQAGLTSGGTYSINGVNFVWPSGYGAQKNNYQAAGQTIAVNSAYGATTLAFLGSSVGGNASGSAIINYADGTTQTIQLGLSDCALGAGKLQPAYGNQIVAAAAYWNHAGSKQTLKNYIFYTEFSLSAYNEPIASVTLPNNSQMHIFAVATR